MEHYIFTHTLGLVKLKGFAFSLQQQELKSHYKSY